MYKCLDCQTEYYIDIISDNGEEIYINFCPFCGGVNFEIIDEREEEIPFYPDIVDTKRR